MEPQQPQNQFDDFEEIFADLDSLPPSRPELADSIFSQTRGVLSRRRWFRRSRLVVAFVACYIVGICSGWVLKPEAAPQFAGEPDARKEAASPDRAIVLPDPVSPKVDRKSTPMVHVEPKVTKALDKAVADAKPPVKRPATSPFESLRRAGDRQLFERGNIRSAMDYYRRALIHATEHELQVQIDRDSWLLISLKQSRLEELKNVRQKRV